MGRRLAADGDKETSARVKGLRKPSVSAWAVNRLWWHDRPRVQAVLDAAEATHEAHRAALAGGAGPEALAEADAHRRRVILDAVRAVREHLDASGRARTEALMRRVQGTLEALAAGTGHGKVGRLPADLEPAGFAGLGGLAALLAGGGFSPAGQAAPRADAQAKADAQARADAAARVEQAKKQVALLEQEEARAHEAAEKAARRARTAATEAEAATQRLSDARKKVAQAAEELAALG